MPDVRGNRCGPPALLRPSSGGMRAAPVPQATAGESCGQRVACARWSRG